MSTFADSSNIAASKPDPAKHVNYVQGMILGVDDFTQEFAYLSGRDQWIARDLLGYGTVCGLKVDVKEEVRDGVQGPWVHVAPGTAVNPQGQMIRVRTEQCANLDKWLLKNKTVGSPPESRVNVYVVLCYRVCPTDNVPIPGEPCRSEGDLMAPSRWQDDFILELRLEPPAQTEEDAIRDFVKWVRDHIEITEEPGDFNEDKETDRFAKIIRNAMVPETSPPSSPPDYMFDASPPIALRINSAYACIYLRAAFRIWVTELRPKWRAKVVDQGKNCTEAPEPQKSEPAECVLLAELNVHLTAEGSIGGPVEVNEEKRPVLLSMRVLQELVLCGGGMRE